MANLDRFHAAENVGKTLLIELGACLQRISAKLKPDTRVIQYWAREARMILEVKNAIEAELKYLQKGSHRDAFRSHGRDILEDQAARLSKLAADVECGYQSASHPSFMTRLTEIFLTDKTPGQQANLESKAITGRPNGVHVGHRGGRITERAKG